MRIRGILGAVLAVVALAGQAAGAAEGQKGTLTGRVVDAHGKGIAGAHVAATGAADAEATTDERGEFRLELEAGQYTLQFEAEGHAAAAMREPVTVEAGKQTKLRRRVELPDADEGSVVRGSVFAGNGLSIPGARVTIERVPGEDGKPVPSLRREATSDSMGLFAFRLPKGVGRYKLTATHEKYPPASVTVDVTGGEILNAPPLTMGGTRP